MKTNRFRNIFLIFFILLFFGCGYHSAVYLYPQPFDIEFHSYGNILNTFDGYIEKDLVMDGYARALYHLSGYEKELIYKKLIEMNFFDSLAIPQYGYFHSPYYLRVKCGTIEKTISWDFYSNPQSDIEVHLNQLRELLSNIMYTSGAYKMLPPARGGRL